MKKTLSVALAAACAAAMILAAAGCKKSAGNSTKPAAKTSSTVSSDTETTSAATAPSSNNRQPSSAAPTTQAANANDAVKDIALSYYGGSEANGDSVTVTGMETGSDGKLYYFVNANVSGASYPLVISEDATVVLTPEQYQAYYSDSGSTTSYDGGSNAGDDGNSGSDGGDDGSGSADYPDNPVYPYGGNGPDGAEP